MIHTAQTKLLDALKSSKLIINQNRMRVCTSDPRENTAKAWVCGRAEKKLAVKVANSLRGMKNLCRWEPCTRATRGEPRVPDRFAGFSRLLRNHQSCSPRSSIRSRCPYVPPLTVCLICLRGTYNMFIAVCRLSCLFWFGTCFDSFHLWLQWTDW